MKTEHKPNCGNDLALVLLHGVQFDATCKASDFMFFINRVVKTKCPLGGGRIIAHYNMSSNYNV